MQKIPLREIAKADNPRRRVLRLRPIEPTASQEYDLYLIHKWVADEWQDFIKNTLLPNYEFPSSIFTDADGEQLQWLIDQKNSDINNRLVYQTEKLGRWVTKQGQWHGRKTISGVKSATGYDVSPFMRLGDIRYVLEASIRENTSLISGLNADTKKKVEHVIFESFAFRRNKADTAKALSEAMGITRKRARIIAVDQAHKLSSLLTQLRNEQMGIDQYIWRTRRDDRVRKAHAFREGKIFKWAEPPEGGPPGYPINCRCGSEAILNLED